MVLAPDWGGAGIPPGSASCDYLAHELTRWAPTGKLICGHDEESWAVRYTAALGIAVVRSLPELIATALKSIGNGILRTGAERRVPLMIYRTPSWSQWYNSLKVAGNRLDGASIEWTFRVGPAKSFVLYWAVHADIHVTSEGRNKSNEVLCPAPSHIATCISVEQCDY